MNEALTKLVMGIAASYFFYLGCQVVYQSTDSHILFRQTSCGASDEINMTNNYKPNTHAQYLSE